MSLSLSDLFLSREKEEKRDMKDGWPLVGSHHISTLLLLNIQCVIIHNDFVV